MKLKGKAPSPCDVGAWQGACVSKGDMGLGATTGQLGPMIVIPPPWSIQPQKNSVPVLD